MWTLSGFADEISPDVAEQCAVLDRLGIRHLELRSAWGVNVTDLDEEQLTEVGRLLGAHRIGVSAIGSPIGKIDATGDFGEHLDRADRAIAAALRFGARYVRVFSFFTGGQPERHRDVVLERMAALAERAGRAGVILLHENEKEIYGDVPDRVLDIVRTVDSPHLRLAWDPANYVQVGVRPFTEGYRMLRPYTDYVQIKDARLANARVVPSGQGDGEVRETVRALHADGFDGFFSMEPHLAESGTYGGFSGAELFTVATEAFTAILHEEGIPFA